MPRWKPGQSGNPIGRQRGGRNRATQAAEALLEGEAEALTRKAIELALDGDGPALRLCLDRLLPVRKDRAVSFPLPDIETVADLPKATAALLAGVTSGEITPSEAAEVAKSIDVHMTAIQKGDFEVRLAALEARPTDAAGAAAAADDGDEPLIGRFEGR